MLGVKPGSHECVWWQQWQHCLWWQHCLNIHFRKSCAETFIKLVKRLLSLARAICIISGWLIFYRLVCMQRYHCRSDPVQVQSIWGGVVRESLKNLRLQQSAIQLLHWWWHAITPALVIKHQRAEVQKNLRAYLASDVPFWIYQLETGPADGTYNLFCHNLSSPIHCDQIRRN